MATFTYFYKVRVDISKSSSAEQLLASWNEEAQGAVKAMDAGVIQLWKDAADTTVYVIAAIEGENAAEAHGTLLATFLDLPMYRRGEIIIEEASYEKNIINFNYRFIVVQCWKCRIK